MYKFVLFIFAFWTLGLWAVTVFVLKLADAVQCSWWWAGVPAVLAMLAFLGYLLNLVWTIDQKF